MTHDDVQRWLDRYVEAWRTYDPASIGELFTDDATYRYHPWDEPVRGRDEIVKAWLEPDGSASSRDEPDSWRARYEPLAIDGDLAVATGSTTYVDPAGEITRVYENLWVMRFDASGRCSDYTEWFMTPPTA